MEITEIGKNLVKATFLLKNLSTNTDTVLYYSYLHVIFANKIMRLLFHTALSPFAQKLREINIDFSVFTKYFSSLLRSTIRLPYGSEISSKFEVAYFIK